MPGLYEHGVEHPAEGETHLESNGAMITRRYATFVERFAILICLSIFFTTSVLGGVTILLHGFPSFSDPNLGFEARGTVLSSRRISYHKFTQAGIETLSPVPRRTLPSQENSTARAERTSTIQSFSELNTRPVANDDTTRNKETLLGECPYPRFNFPKIVFESSNGDSLFQMKHLKAICDNENKLIRSHPTFLSECLKSNDSSGCCNSWSLGYAVALMNNKSSCKLIDENDVEATKDVLEMCSKYYFSGDLKVKKPTQHGTNIPVDCIDGSIVYTIFHYLLPKSFGDGLQNEKRKNLAFTLSFSPMDLCGSAKCKENMEVIYQDNFKNVNNIDSSLVKIVGLDFALKVHVFNDVTVSDMRLVAVGVVSAILIIWIYTGSFFITIGSVANMFMSFIFALFLYYIVFRINFFPFLNLTSAVLILGIGADDTFIYVDRWKAARIKIARRENTHSLVLAEATRHAFLTLVVTSLTTSAALFATAKTDVIAAKCFAIFAGSAILANLLYTVTWLPAIIAIYDKYFYTNQFCHASYCQRQCLIVGKGVQLARMIYDNILKVQNAFFQTYLPKFVFVCRFLWIIVFFLIGVAGLIIILVYPGLSLPESGEFRLYGDMQLFENYDQNYKDDLAFVNDSRNTFELAFIWGVLPTHEQNLWDPLDLGTLELDNKFTLGDNKSQLWLTEFCQAIQGQAYYGKEGDGRNFCFIDSFTTWMNRSCLNSHDNSCCEQGSFPFSEQLFDKCVPQFISISCQTSLCNSHTPGVRFGRNDSIRALYLNFESSVPYSVHFKTVDEFWKHLSSWAEQQILKAPPGLRGGWVYSHQRAQLTLYDLQSSIIGGTVSTICISLAIATIVLLAVTQNVLISSYAMVTITFVVSSVVGCLVLLGWKLNIFEAITFSLAVGLSVDFTIHYGVAFTIAPFEDRKKRTFFTIETLSSSISGAAVSTFSAGIVMIPAVVIGFSQIGVFLTLVMSLSWLFSTFFFSSLCMTVGPNGSFGQMSLKRFWEAITSSYN